MMIGTHAARLGFIAGADDPGTHDPLPRLIASASTSVPAGYSPGNSATGFRMPA